MMRRILLGYDGSDSARAACDMALDFARRYGAELHVLAVARRPEFGDDVEIEAVIENSRNYYNKVLQRLQTELGSETIISHFEVVVGHPAEQLIRYAETYDIDHIVVGHRGNTLFERWLIGSVARQVIAYAHCAVTVVRK